MARRSSGGRPAPRAAPRRPVQNPPHSVFHAASRAAPPAPAQPQSGSLMGSIGSTIAQGVAFAGGNAVAHRAVDAIMGPRTIQVESEAAAGATVATSPAMGGAAGSDSCSIHSQAFQDCINNYGSDISKCQFYLDMLSECRRNSMLSA